MAELRSIHSTLHLTPLRFEFSDEEWILSELSLRLDVSHQKLLVKPKQAPTLPLHTYQRLLAGARKFLASCTSNGDNLFDLESFVFTPTELNFEFAVLDADLSPDGEGEVTVRVMVRVDDMNPSYVGSTFSVDASQFRRFLSTLEAEIEQIVHQRAESIFVTAEA